MTKYKKIIQDIVNMKLSLLAVGSTGSEDMKSLIILKTARRLDNIQLTLEKTIKGDFNPEIPSEL